MAFGDYSVQPEFNFSPQFVINKMKNLTSNHKVETDPNPNQVPFFLNIPGVPSLRERDKAYKVEK